jgi:PAS domain S-box-containing protein
VLLVANPENFLSIKHKVQFAPFIGKNIDIVENKAISILLDEIKSGIDKTRQRRKFLTLTDLTKTMVTPELSGTEEAKRTYLGKFMDAAPVGAILIDQKGTVISINKQAALYFSKEIEDLKEQPFTNLFPKHIQPAIREFIASESGKPGNETKEIEIEVAGISRYFELLVSERFRENENTFSIVIITDQTERKEWTARMRENEERLRLALNSTGLGTWELIIATNEIKCDSRCLELFGLSENIKLDYKHFLTLVHEDDRQEVTRAIQQTIKNKIPLSIDYKIGKEPHLKWVKATGTLYHGVNDKPDRLIGTVQDITEILQTQRELEDSLKQKDEFIGIASHELKTPLTSVKAYVQLLARNVAQEKNKIYVEKASTHIDKLSELIADLLDVSKIHAGKLQFHFSDFDFYSFVEEAVANFRDTVKTHDIILEGKVNCTIHADKHRLEQVLINFLSNAVKYSPKGDKVIVKLGFNKRTHMLMVKVIDFGVGIPKEKLPNIFQKFFRVETTATHFEGLGIGLYIAAEIIRGHQGKVKVDSEEGKGSVFQFSLPAKTVN